MYGSSTFLVSRGLYDQRAALADRSPYRFEPGEPDDAEARKPPRGTLALLAVYLLVVAVVTAALWIGSGDKPVTDQARRTTRCTHATGLWSGCLPTK